MMKINDHLCVYSESGCIAFEYNDKASDAYNVVRVLPVELAEILFVLRGMSEYEEGHGYTISHRIEPTSGYVLLFCGKRVFINMKQAFILMLALERVLARYV